MRGTGRGLRGVLHRRGRAYLKKRRVARTGKMTASISGSVVVSKRRARRFCRFGFRLCLGGSRASRHGAFFTRLVDFAIALHDTVRFHFILRLALGLEFAQHQTQVRRRVCFEKSPRRGRRRGVLWRPGEPNRTSSCFRGYGRSGFVRLSRATQMTIPKKRADAMRGVPRTLAFERRVGF